MVTSKKQKRKSKALVIGGLSLFVLLLIAAAVFLVQQTAFPRTPDCNFENASLNAPGVCFYEGVLPQERDAVSWQFDYFFESVAGTELLGRQLVTPFATGGPWTEEDGEQYDDSCREDREHISLALYRIPSNFPEVYDLYFEAYTDATGQIDETFATASMDMYVEYIDIPYSYGGIELCTKDDRDDCSNGDYALVHTYTDERSSSTYGDYKEDRVNIRHEVNLAGMTREDLYVDDDFSLNQPVTAQVWAKGTVPHDAFLIEGMTQGNMALAVELNAEEDSRCGVDIARATNPPTEAYLSYREVVYPTDVTYFVGDVEIETLSGAQKDDFTTLDVAEQINEACNRDKNSNECIFKIKLTSTKPGLMWIDNHEEPVFKLSEQEPNDDPVDDEPGDKEPISTKTWIIIGSSVALIGVAGGMTYSVRKGLKKKGKKSGVRK